jgi:hypothetical protein
MAVNVDHHNWLSAQLGQSLLIVESRIVCMAFPYSCQTELLSILMPQVLAEPNID